MVVSLYVWMVGLLFFALWAVLLLLTGIVHTGPFFDKMVKGLCKSLLWVLRIKVHARGIENIDPTKQYIIMMNHVNIFDGFVFYSRFPGFSRGIEEESHFKWPLYGWVIRRMGQIPVNRRRGRQALDSLRRAADLIRKKREFSFAVLPEGTRTLDGKLSPFKKGGFLLAIEAGLDILPIIQVGSFQIKRKNNWMIKPGRIDLIFDKPVTSGGYNRKNVHELMTKVRDIFLNHLGE